MPRRNTITPPPSSDPPPRRRAPPRAITTDGVDLNSRSATIIPGIDWACAPEYHDRLILVMRCTDAVKTCWEIKKWLFQEFRPEDYKCGPEILRINEQEIDKINNSDEGTLIWFEGAGELLEDDGGALDLSILALLMPGDGHVRWFYSIKSIASLMNRLADMNLIETHAALEHGLHGDRKKHPCKKCRIFMYMKQGFEQAYKIPHHPDYYNAMIMTDYAPDIIDPDTSYKRLEANEWLHQNRPQHGERDMMDDRYRDCEEIDPVELELASNADLPVSEYLLIKRCFFQGFYEDVMRSEKKIEMQAAAEGETQRGIATRRIMQKDKKNMVRTDYAHQQWLERSYADKMKGRKAKRLVTAWRILGLLEEWRLLHWIRNGGMLENIKPQEEEEAVKDAEEKD